MKRILIFTLCVSFFVACQTDKPTEKQANTTTEAPAATQEVQTNALPSLPMDTLTMLWEQCDYVDYVFYYTNFSISQDEQSSIRSSLRHIAEDPAVIKANCKPIGRLFYQVDGENRLEGDLHLSEGCLYFIFYQKGKQVYANSMTQEGLQFYQNLFSQIQNSAQGNSNG